MPRNRLGSERAGERRPVVYYTDAKVNASGGEEGEGGEAKY